MARSIFDAIREGIARKGAQKGMGAALSPEDEKLLAETAPPIWRNPKMKLSAQSAPEEPAVRRPGVSAEISRRIKEKRGY